MKKKLKGLLSLWLAVVLVLGTPTVPVLAEGTEHENHAGSEWKSGCVFSGDLSEQKYYLSSGGNISSGGVGVSVSGNTTICLNGKKLEGGTISVNKGGILTMDDCQSTQEKCYASFKVEQDGVLNLKGGQYYSDITVVSGNAVGKGGKLNIGDKSDRTTDVTIAGASYDNGICGYVLKSKIDGKFNLIKPDQNFRAITGETDKVEVFDWYLLSKDDVTEMRTRTGVAISSVDDVKKNYENLWKGVKGSYCEVHLYSKWADGYKVTYKNYDGPTDSEKMIGVVSGDSITLEQLKDKVDYRFDGWLDSDNNIHKSGEKITPTKNIVFTAKWTQKSSGGGSYVPAEPTTPTEPTTPDNANDNHTNDNTGTTDWNYIKSDIANAKNGDTVSIDLSKNTTVPGDILNSIKGKDVTLALDLGNGMSWKINGNSITADNLGNINFGTNLNSDTIPVEVLNKVSGERYNIKVHLEHDGPFGFEAVLAVNLDAKNAGLYANLFYFNPQTKELEFVGADIIKDNGEAEFTFTHASDYAIIIDKVSMDPNANIPTEGTELTDQKTKAVYKVTKSGKTGGTVEYLKSTDKKTTSVSIPATVTIDGITYKVTSIAANAFKNNTTVKKITIGKNVTKIGSKAFYGCKNLKDITVKTTKLTNDTIGSKAFKGISSDAYIFVPQSKQKSYKKVLVAKGVSKKDAVVSIPEKGEKLTDKKTKAVYKVTKEGKTGGTVAYVKSTDKKATSIVIPATVTIDGITYKVTSISANAFKNNKTVEKITIGKNVAKIGAKAFYGCTKLKSITIKTTKLTNKNVGKDVFKGIANDAKIKVPEKKLDIYKKIFAKKGLGDQAVEKK